MARARNRGAVDGGKILRREVSVENFLIDIHVNQGSGRIDSVASGAHFGKTASDGQRHITAGGNFLGKGRGGRTESAPEPQWMALWKNTFPLKRGGHRRFQSLGKAHQLTTGRTGAKAEVEKRPAAFFQEGPDFRQGFRTRCDGRRPILFRNFQLGPVARMDRTLCERSRAS
jgi:hypothetical protein